MDYIVTEMSKKKQGGKLTQHERPNPKYLGIKIGNDQKVSVGSILVRQRGTKIHAGQGVGTGREHTLFALREGVVKFGTKTGKKIVSVN